MLLYETEDIQLSTYLCIFTSLYLPQGYNTLLWTHTTTLDHDKVIVDFTIVRKATHGSD